MPRMPRGQPTPPALEDRPTDYGSTNFDRSALGSLSTAPVPWDRTEHAAFDGRSCGARPQREKNRPRSVERMITLGLLLLSAAVAAVVFLVVQR